VWLDVKDVVAYQFFAAHNLLEFTGQRSSAHIWIAHEHERTILRKILTVCANRLAEISPVPKELLADIIGREQHGRDLNRRMDTAIQAVTGEMPGGGGGSPSQTRMGSAPAPRACQKAS